MPGEEEAFVAHKTGHTVEGTWGKYTYNLSLFLLNVHLNVFQIMESCIDRLQHPDRNTLVSDLSVNSF